MRVDANKVEFNVPDVITDPRTRTQYLKGKFLGKVSRANAVVPITSVGRLGWLCPMLRTDRQDDQADLRRQDRAQVNARQTSSTREGPVGIGGVLWGESGRVHRSRCNKK